MLEEPAVPLVVTERIAARMLSVSIAALRRWRRENRGPRFVRLSRCVRYRVQDLEEYINQNTQKTSVAGRDLEPVSVGTNGIAT